MSEQARPPGGSQTEPKLVCDLKRYLDRVESPHNVYRRTVAVATVTNATVWRVGCNLGITGSLVCAGVRRGEGPCHRVARLCARTRGRRAVLAAYGLQAAAG